MLGDLTAGRLRQVDDHRGQLTKGTLLGKHKWLCLDLLAVPQLRYGIPPNGPCSNPLYNPLLRGSDYSSAGKFEIGVFPVFVLIDPLDPRFPQRTFR